MLLGHRLQEVTSIVSSVLDVFCGVVGRYCLSVQSVVVFALQGTGCVYGMCLTGKGGELQNIFLLCKRVCLKSFRLCLVWVVVSPA